MFIGHTTQKKNEVLKTEVYKSSFTRIRVIRVSVSKSFFILNILEGLKD